MSLFVKDYEKTNRPLPPPPMKLQGHQPEKVLSRPKIPRGLSTGARKEMQSIQNDEWAKAYIKHKTGFDVEFGIAIFRRSDLVPIKSIFLLEEGKRKANLRAAYEFEAFQDKVTTGNLVSVYEMFDALCESIVEAINKEADINPENNRDTFQARGHRIKELEEENEKLKEHLFNVHYCNCELDEESK